LQEFYRQDPAAREARHSPAHDALPD